MKVAAFIDPWHPSLWNDGLFQDGPLNRDDVQRPWMVLKETFEAAGIPCHTADFLLTGKIKAEQNLYYSIGQRDHYHLLRYRPGTRLMGYWQMEPPVVDPVGYQNRLRMIEAFETVYGHNPELFPGTKKFYWPQVKDRMLPSVAYDRPGKICMINGNKEPHPGYDGLWGPQLYQTRLRVLNGYPDIDLYGPGWEDRPNWKGAPPDKFKVLADYDAAICFENQRMPGYVTEKIFECLFAKTVPIYLGAPDIADYVDPECFVHVQDVADIRDLRICLDPKPYRRAMRAYLESPRFQKFTSTYFAQSVVATALQNL